MSQQRKNTLINHAKSREVREKKLNSLKKRQKELLSSEKHEINAEAKISLRFHLDKSGDYKSYLTLLGKSPYCQKAIELFDKWGAENNWRDRGKDERRGHFLCLVANLLSVPKLCGAVDKPVDIKVSESEFLRETVLFFRKNKLINYRRGYTYSEAKTGSRAEFKNSKIYSTVEFDKIFPSVDNEFEINLHVTHLDSENVRKKNKDEQRIPLTDWEKDRTRVLSGKITKKNEVNLSHKIIIKDRGEEYPCCTKLTVVYKRNLQRGGRLYATGWNWQNVSRDFRPHIFIDDEPTVELDYSGLHPRMLYAKKGIQYQGDLYDLSDSIPEYKDDPKLRKLSKLTLLILINSKDDSNIIGTITKDLRENNPDLLNYIQKKYRTKTKKSKKGDFSRPGIYKRIINALKDKHEIIAEFFHSDSGARLQKKDGKMAVMICLEFAKHDIPCLPVHDSFIVQERHGDFLMELMDKAYRKYNKEFVCPVDKK